MNSSGQTSKNLSLAGLVASQLPLVLLALALLAACWPQPAESTSINIYKHRYPFYGGYGYGGPWYGGYGGGYHGGISIGGGGWGR